MGQGEIDPFRTSHSQPGGEIPGSTIYRMKVKAINLGGNAKLVTANLYNGTVTGARDYTVKAEGKAVDDEILATIPVGGTTETYNSRPVVYQEIAGGISFPPANGLYRVLMITSYVSPTNYVRGWDMPRGI